VSVRRLSAAGLAALHRAVNDPAAVDRFRSKVVQVPGSQCLWWTGAVSGRGHGRFWFGRGRVVIAHRFAFALAYGVEVLDQVRVLGHRCDNRCVSGSARDMWWRPLRHRTVVSG
jgi:hypothetical protein